MVMKNLSNLASSKKFMDEYYKILSPEFPEFLYDYIDAPAMQRLKGISIACGCNYTDIYNFEFFCSNLDHSIGVALIIWNFTHDKTATLAGLMHDIADPSFKHCIDFMNGDYEKQESISEGVKDIIMSSSEIMNLLRRDNIDVKDVADYTKYPIADNNTPQLSADRLDYNFTQTFAWSRAWGMDDIKEFYQDLIILTNEDGVEELGFRTLNVAEKFINGAHRQWPHWCSSDDKIVMQFIADTLAGLNKIGKISIADLRKLSENELIEIIKNCGEEKIVKAFEKFQNNTEWFEGDIPPSTGVYCRALKSKKRYINPLVQTNSGAKRITDLSGKAKQQIENFLAYETPKYAWIEVEDIFTK